jgi:hypothetical protein
LEEAANSPDASTDDEPNATRFKVVNTKDKTNPQQVHENDLSPYVGFAGRT